VEAALDAEKLYFRSHPVYSTMPQHLLGCDNLTSQLSKVMFTHIKHNLPEITREIKEKMKDIDERLVDLGPPLPSDGQEKMHILWNMITDFCTIYKNTITGKYDAKRNNSSQNVAGRKEISGGAKIKIQFYGLYKEYSGNYCATTDYSDFDIERAIIMHEGDTIPGFPSVDVFIYLIQPQLERLRDPALDCLNEVYHFLETLANGIVEKIFVRFPTIIPDIMEIIVGVLQAERDKAREIVESIIDSEQNYLFTNDIDYLQNRTEIVSADNEPQPPAG
jgi:hypothetical protein